MSFIRDYSILATTRAADETAQRQPTGTFEQADGESPDNRSALNGWCVCVDSRARAAGVRDAEEGVTETDVGR